MPTSPKKKQAKPSDKSKRPSLAVVGRMYRVRSSANAPKTKRNASKKPKRPPVNRTFKPVPKTRMLIKDSLSFAWQHRRVLIGPVIVYGIAHIFLVSGFSGHVDVVGIQKSLEDFIGNHPLGNSAITTAIVAFGASSPGSENPSGKVYQALLPIVGTLAFIWTVRRLKKSQPVKLREAFYFSMQPFFPLVLVLVSIALRLIPLSIVSYIMAMARTNGFAASTPETILFVLGWLAIVTLTFAWIVPYVLAIYSVTLPEVYPGQAKYAARAMVKGQRINIVGRMVGGVALGLACGALLIFLSIVWLPTLVVPLTLSLQFVGLMLLHVYFFHVYRSLL